MKYNKIPFKLSIYLRYLHQYGKIIGKDLVKRFRQYSRQSIYRHTSLPLSHDKADKRKLNKGKPRAGLKNVSNRIIRRVLNKNGYGFHQCREKGQHTAENCKVRLKFAKTIKRKKLPNSFWKVDLQIFRSL